MNVIATSGSLYEALAIEAKKHPKQRDGHSGYMLRVTEYVDMKPVMDYFFNIVMDTFIHYTALILTATTH